MRLTVLLVLSLSACSLLADSRSKRFYEGAERLSPGMTQEEVVKLIGEPGGKERQFVAPGELREVWIYHVDILDFRADRRYPSLRVIVFSNQKLLAIDPPDPYALSELPSVAPPSRNQPTRLDPFGR